MSLQDFLFTSAVLGRPVTRNDFWENAGKAYASALFGANWRTTCILKNPIYACTFLISDATGNRHLKISRASPRKRQECIGLTSYAGVGEKKEKCNLPDGTHGEILVNESGVVVEGNSFIDDRLSDAADGAPARQYRFDNGKLNYTLSYNNGNPHDPYGVPHAIVYWKNGKDTHGVMTGGDFITPALLTTLIIAAKFERAKSLTSP